MDVYLVETTKEQIKREKLVHRTEVAEAISIMDKYRSENGMEETDGVRKARDGSRKVIAQELEETKKVIAERNDTLQEIKEQLLPDNIKKMDKIELSRQELKDMGIELNSRISFGSIRRLPQELKQQLDEEVSSVLLDKMLMMVNSIDINKVTEAKLKDLMLSVGIIADKHRIFAGKTEKKQEVNVNVQHSITDLIAKAGNKKMGELYGTEADIIDVTQTSTQQTTNDEENDEEDDW